MAEQRKRLSELPSSTDLTGLYTLGVNSENEGVKIPIGNIVTTTINTANSAAATANSAASTANSAASTANSALAKADAAKLEAFIQEVESYGVVYNRTTGYFELNGLTDITEAQMREIYKFKQTLPYMCTIDSSTIRTNLFVQSTLGGIDKRPNLSILFRGTEIEVISLQLDYKIAPSSIRGMVATNINNNKLREIMGEINVAYVADSEISPFSDATFPLFTTIKLFGVKKNVNLKSLPALSLASLSYLVTNAANTTPITVTLHADAFARLTDELLEAAEAKQISFIEAS